MKKSSAEEEKTKTRRRGDEETKRLGDEETRRRGEFCRREDLIPYKTKF